MKYFIRYKEFYIKKTVNKFRSKYIEEISIKSDAKKIKIIKYQKLLLLYIHCTKNEVFHQGFLQ